MTKESLKSLEAATGMDPKDKDVLRDLLTGVDRWQERQGAAKKEGKESARSGVHHALPGQRGGRRGEGGSGLQRLRPLLRGNGHPVHPLRGHRAGGGRPLGEAHGHLATPAVRPRHQGGSGPGQGAERGRHRRPDPGRDAGGRDRLLRRARERELAGLSGLVRRFGLHGLRFRAHDRRLRQDPPGGAGHRHLRRPDPDHARGRMGARLRLPRWMQTLTLAVPTRWAMDGLDAVTWRGGDFGAALLPICALLGFTALFGRLAAVEVPVGREWEKKERTSIRSCHCEEAEGRRGNSHDDGTARRVAPRSDRVGVLAEEGRRPTREGRALEAVLPSFRCLLPGFRFPALHSVSPSTPSA